MILRKNNWHDNCVTYLMEKYLENLIVFIIFKEYFIHVLIIVAIFMAAQK